MTDDPDKFKKLDPRRAELAGKNRTFVKVEKNFNPFSLASVKH